MIYKSVYYLQFFIMEILVLIFVSSLFERLLGLNIDNESVAYFVPDHLIFNKESGYFGYSMTTYHSQNKSWLLVGAPKSNSSRGSSISPGVVHACHVSYQNTTCKLKYQSDDLQNLGREQMFGATLLSRESNGINEIIVCGFKKAEDSSGKGPFSPGICSVFNDETMVKNLKAPGNPIKTIIYVENGLSVQKSHHFSSYAQIGFSVHKIHEDGRLLLGTPGIMSWKGGINILSKGKECTYYNSKADIDLSGYAVSSLRNNGKLLIIISSPKFDGGGKVDILNIHENCTATPIQTLNVSCFECMFGYSILAVDVDGDGVDEIMVGAPFYNITKGDEGSVFVYKETNDVYQQIMILSGSGKRGSKFGTTIYSLEDVNMDGFKDVIIGSPYEDQGVAYLYLGSNDTFTSSYSQMINAPGDDLMRFGYSYQVLSINDSYGGLAIGAYLSDRIVLMKIRPQHVITGEMLFHPDHVAWTPSNCVEYLNQTSAINVSLVFTYIISEREIEKYGHLFYGETEIVYELLIDSFHRRGYLIDENQKKLHKLKEKLTFNGHEIILVRNLTIIFDVKNYLKKQSTYSSQNVSLRLNMHVSKHDEIINPSFQIISRTSKQIRFKAQSEFVECHPNISYVLSVKTDAIVGARSMAVIHVSMLNHGDSTHRTEFLLGHAHFIRLIKISQNFVKCNSSSNDTHVCQIDALILRDSMINFEVHFSVKDGLNSSTEIMFSPLEGHGSTRKIDLLSWYRSEIIVIKASNGSVSETSHDIRHYFDIRNNGPGLHKTMNLTIFVPIISSVCCMSDIVEADVKTRSMTKRSTILDISSFEKGTNLTTFSKNKKMVTNMTCAYMDCHVYHLEVVDVSPEDTIDLRILVNINGSLSSFIRNLKYESQIVIHPSLINETQINFEASSYTRPQLVVELRSILIFHSNVKHIPLWLILVCLLIGTIHLIALVLVLKRCGFFRRKGRERLEEEKSLMKNVTPQIAEEELIQKTFM